MSHAENTQSGVIQLNAPQKQAVDTTEGAVLVLAGAGTGKTRVLTTRIAHIINTGLSYSSEILAVTFTNKAAAEMRLRVEKSVGHSIDGMWIGTFHSLCVRILRPHAELVGLQGNFTILDKDDQLRLIKQLIKAEHLDEKLYPPRTVALVIDQWKNRGIRYDVVPPGEPVMTLLYGQYQERLRILNAVDFGDLLLHCLTLFKENPIVLEQFRKKFRYILVDEYQDTNIAQYLWLRLLAPVGSNICCVGDDDQSIYGWRGAEVGNILRFETDYPGTTVIRLEENYRSTAHILGAASGLIRHNEGRLGKTLWTQDAEGDPVLIRGTWNSEDESRFVSDEIEAFQRQGKPLSEIAVLVRAGFQTREFEERFLKTGIPYRVIGGLRFYERSEIKDAIAYLRLLVQPNDGLAFERIINLPKRGLGQTTLQSIHVLSREQEISLPKAAYRFAQGAKPGIKKALYDFFDLFEKWRALLDVELHSEIVKIVLDESGYTRMWQEDTAPDAPGRLENLKEFVNAFDEFQSIHGFLDHVSLVMDNNQNKTEDMVNIMTLHAAKGLEFDVVFLAGWEESLFPHSRSLNDAGKAALEEERRLGYVGISRARQHAIITYALKRRMYNQGFQNTGPSRFLKELPKVHCRHIAANGAETDTQRIHVIQANPVAMRQDYEGRSPRYALPSFQPNERVFHQKFGYGQLIALEANRATVKFEHSDTKKIIIDFLEKA